ncbi:flagellar assembly protein FliH [Alcaligenes faecalis]|nr:flagellar assembly protein FliH [Alcaligenes faecalis]
MPSHRKASAYSELQDSWTRWQMQGLDDPAPANEPQEPEFVPPTQEELQRELDEQRSQAQEEGHQQGYQAGFDQGHAAGLAAGQESGHALGYEAGISAGMAKAQEQIDQYIKEFVALNQNCAQSIEMMNQEMGQALIQLATRIAEHVLQSTITSEPGRIRDLVAEVLRSDPGDTSALELSLHPDDISLVREFLIEQGEPRAWRLQEDAQLQRGECRVRSSYGDIDATFAIRWKRALASLGLAVPSEP